MFLLGKHYKSHGLYSLKITPPPHSMLKDVRANCFCASLLRTQIHVMDERARAK